MRSFLKMFFASLLSLIIFCLILFFLAVGFVGALATREKTEVEDKSVLLLDLGEHWGERKQQDPLSRLSVGEDQPGLYDLVRLIAYAKTDDKIRGIYIKADGNANGFASSNEVRQALLDFKTSRKFVYAYGDVMDQQAYAVAQVADKIYVNPSGEFDWSGYQVTLPFVKGMLDKLDIKAQIFYAGKFKSATEIFRTEKMTPENRLQTTEWLGDIYQNFLFQSAGIRKLDSGALHALANTAAIQTPQDALAAKLIDGVKYDDQVKDEIKAALKIGKNDKMHFISAASYADAVNLRKTGKDRIAVIYAEGDIVDGEGSGDNIGGDRFRALIRRARLDRSVKAIVLRVNSGGGSALASENIWRELQMAKADKKPVVVSFGDVAASGGYYIACGADSIFAHPNTITGSIGVFGVIPNMEAFFKNKMGITFDAVKTAPYADAGGVTRPLNEAEQRIIQADIERIYLLFKQRVASGRKKDMAYVDSIAQGRVWSGADALRLGLVDKLGSMQDAIASAARLARLDSYGLKEYPESESWLNNFLERRREEPSALIRQQVGEENYKVYQQMVRIRELTGSIQARLPYELIFR